MNAMIRYFQQGTAQAAKSSKVKSTSHQAVLAPELLLNNRLRQDTLKTIKEFAHIPFEHYSALGESLINNLAQFLQKIPYFKNFDDERLHYFLDISLLKAAHSLQIYQEKEAAATSFPRKRHHAKNALFSYALLSASMLVDIGKVFTHFTVAICDDNGDALKGWQPLKGYIKNEGTHYIVQKNPTRDEVLARYLTPLIAQSLMPQAGLDWIASDAAMLKMWLAMLQGEEAYAGTLAHIISLSDQRVASVIRELNIDELNEISAAEETDAHNQDDAIADLIDWLDEQIEKGNFAESTLINNDQVVITPSVLKAFNDAFPGHKNAFSVAFTNQHNMLGITPKSGDDHVFSKYFGKRGKANVVVNQFLNSNLPSLQTTKTTQSKTSGVQLSQKGPPK